MPLVRWGLAPSLAACNRQSWWKIGVGSDVELWTQQAGDRTQGRASVEGGEHMKRWLGRIALGFWAIAALALVVVDSGHAIQWEQPERVIAATRWVIDAVRAGAAR
jgi:hypothetical protein